MTPPPTATSTGTPKPSPTQDGLIESCVNFHKAVSGDTCDKIVKQFGVFTLSEFQSWNPAVGDDCAGIWVGYYYCVGISGTPTAKPTTSVPPKTTTSPSGPSPTQEGIISTCNRFHQAASGESCSTIVAKYGTFTLDNFIAWNPAVNKDCSALWLGYYYCIGIPGTPTQKPTPTTTSGPAGPSPTQDGIIKTCQRYHKAVAGDTCAKITDKYGTFTLGNFIQWNPAVMADCSGLWAGYYYCIGNA